MDPERAATMMELMPPAGASELATKRDLDALEARIGARFDAQDARFEARLAVVRADLTRSLGALIVASQAAVITAVGVSPPSAERSALPTGRAAAGGTNLHRRTGVTPARWARADRPGRHRGRRPPARRRARSRVRSAPSSPRSRSSSSSSTASRRVVSSCDLSTVSRTTSSVGSSRSSSRGASVMAAPVPRAPPPEPVLCGDAERGHSTQARGVPARRFGAGRAHH